MNFTSTNGCRIVCLCGSTKFVDYFETANLEETLAGNIVLSIGSHRHSDHKLGLTDLQKRMVDALHLSKIDLCDEILIINRDGYVGESTIKEIQYAILSRKPVRFFYTSPAWVFPVFEKLGRQDDINSGYPGVHVSPAERDSTVSWQQPDTVSKANPRCCAGGCDCCSTGESKAYSSSSHQIEQKQKRSLEDRPDPKIEDAKRWYDTAQSIPTHR